MARVLLLLVLVLLVAGGGTGAWWFGVRGEPIPFMEQETGDRPQPRNRAASEFMDLKPLSFSVIQEGQVTQLMTVVVSLEVAGRSGREAVTANRPRLRDRLLEELHGVYGLRYVREHENEMDVVRDRLLQAGRDVLGDDLRGLFIQGVEGRESS